MTYKIFYHRGESHNLMYFFTQKFFEHINKNKSFDLTRLGFYLLEIIFDQGKAKLWKRTQILKTGHTVSQFSCCQCSELLQT